MTAVVSMASRKIHAATCRFVNRPGSMSFPYADQAAIELLPHCKVCKPGSLTTALAGDPR